MNFARVGRVSEVAYGDAGDAVPAAFSCDVGAAAYRLCVDGDAASEESQQGEELNVHHCSAVRQWNQP